MFGGSFTYIDADNNSQTVKVDETDRLDFLHAENGRNAQNTGLNDVDLWIGGLAERVMPFGGMLGSTFEYVFELQLEHLQNGDRFYYLTRTAGMNFFNELEQNSFASMIMQNTNARHLPLDVFWTRPGSSRSTGYDQAGQRQPAVQSGQQHRRGQRPDRGRRLVPLVDRNPGSGSTDATRPDSSAT